MRATTYCAPGTLTSNPCRIWPRTARSPSSDTHGSDLRRTVAPAVSLGQPLTHSCRRRRMTARWCRGSLLTRFRASVDRAPGKNRTCARDLGIAGKGSSTCGRMAICPVQRPANVQRVRSGPGGAGRKMGQRSGQTDDRLSVLGLDQAESDEPRCRRRSPRLRRPRQPHRLTRRASRRDSELRRPTGGGRADRSERVPHGPRRPANRRARRDRVSS